MTIRVEILKIEYQTGAFCFSMWPGVPNYWIHIDIIGDLLDIKFNIPVLVPVI